MKDKNNTKVTREDFRELISGTSSADFDGHTEFVSLTPEQRLMWLSQSAQFIVLSRQELE